MRGGKALLRRRGNLAAAGLDEDRWRRQWKSARLSCPVDFTYRGGDVAAQAATGAIRYDISQDPASGRWYLDASWKTPPAQVPSLEELRRHPVVAVDVNAGHLVVTADGNVLGPVG